MAFWGNKRDEEPVQLKVKEIRARDVDAPREVHAEKVVIVTGPGLRTILSYIAFGAALGAGATFFFSQKSSSDASESAAKGDEDESATRESLAARAGNLAERVKNLTGRVRGMMQSAGDVLGPVLQEALGDARDAARQAQEELASDLSSRSDTERPQPDFAEAKREVVATGSVAVGVASDGKVEVEVPSNAEVDVPAGTRPIEVSDDGKSS